MHSTLIRSRTSEIEGMVEDDWDTVEADWDTVGIGLHEAGHGHDTWSKRGRRDTRKSLIIGADDYTVLSIDWWNRRYEYKDKLKKAKAELDKADKDDLSATKVR